jgi:hypothetical protein
MNLSIRITATDCACQMHRKRSEKTIPEPTILVEIEFER